MIEVSNPMRLAACIVGVVVVWAISDWHYAFAFLLGTSVGSFTVQLKKD